MAEIYLRAEMDITNQEVQIIPPRVNPNRYTLRHMIIKLSKVRNKKRLFIHKKWHSSSMREIL